MKKFLLPITLVVCLANIFTFYSNKKVIAEPIEAPIDFPVAEEKQEPEIIVKEPEIEIQVPIAQNNRIYNKSGDQCGWASLETLARHHEIKSLYDLTKNHKGLINDNNGPNVLKRKKVEFKYQKQTDKNVEILKTYVEQKHYGAAVGLDGTHMVTLCHFDEKNGIAKFIDNSGPNALEIQTWDIKKFLERWDGTTYVLIPD